MFSNHPSWQQQHCDDYYFVNISRDDSYFVKINRDDYYFVKISRDDYYFVKINRDDYYFVKISIDDYYYFVKISRGEQDSGVRIEKIGWVLRSDVI